MNVNPTIFPAKGANRNLTVDTPNNNIAAQFINYNLTPKAKSPASPKPGTIYDCEVISAS